jgi:hypothetical protein
VKTGITVTKTLAGLRDILDNARGSLVMPQEILPETGQYLRVQGILEDYGKATKEMDSRA